MATVERLRERDPAPSFDQMLEDLASRMQQYDELMSRRSDMLDVGEVLDDQLSGLNLELPIEHFPDFVARNALEKIILDKKLLEVDQRLKALRWGYADSLDLLLTRNLKGRKVEISPTDPERYFLNKLRGKGKDVIFKGYTTSAQQGRIQDIELDPIFGGYLKITGRFYSYEARELVDRKNHYQPAFSIANIE